MTRTLSVLFFCLFSLFAGARTTAQTHVQVALSGPGGTGQITIDTATNTFVADLPGATQSHGYVVTNGDEICLYIEREGADYLMGCFINGPGGWYFHRTSPSSDYTITDSRTW